MMRNGLWCLLLLLPSVATAQSHGGGGISGVSGGLGIDFAVSQVSAPTTTQAEAGGYAQAIERAMSGRPKTSKETK